MDNNNEIESLFTVEIFETIGNVSVGSASHQGSRQEQQDSLYVDDDSIYYENGRMIAVLCDGMGGLFGGAIASKTAVDVTKAAIRENPKVDNIPAFYNSLVNNLDTEIYNLKDETGKRLKSGSTMVSVIVDDGKLFWASVGDSAIYIIRNAKLFQINEFHNYAMLLKKRVDRGEISLETAEKHPKKEALISYLGMGGIKYIDSNIRPVNLENNDIILLASDGLYRALSEQDIIDTLTKNDGTMGQLADNLVSTAVNKAILGQDNTSVILIKYEEL